MRLSTQHLETITTEIIANKNGLSIRTIKINGREGVYTGWKDGVTVTVDSNHKMAQRVLKSRHMIQSMEYQELKEWTLESWNGMDPDSMW
jgi:hypothetical protein